MKVHPHSKMGDVLCEAYRSCKGNPLVLSLGFRVLSLHHFLATKELGGGPRKRCFLLLSAVSIRTSVPEYQEERASVS